jgi:hypothetical protein
MAFWILWTLSSQLYIKDAFIVNTRHEHYLINSCCVFTTQIHVRIRYIFNPQLLLVSKKTNRNPLCWHVDINRWLKTSNTVQKLDFGNQRMCYWNQLIPIKHVHYTGVCLRWYSNYILLFSIWALEERLRQKDCIISAKFVSLISEYLFRTSPQNILRNTVFEIEAK